MNLTLQDESGIVASAGYVFKELNFFLCLNKWTPGSQKRSVMTIENRWKLFTSLRKEFLENYC